MVNVKKVKCEPTDWQIAKGGRILLLHPDPMIYCLSFAERSKLVTDIYKAMVGNPPKGKVK